MGAVVVKDGIIVGKGRTQRPGSAHAEVMALRDAGELARGAAIYVTLEPCCHYGRTPPCTKAIIDAGLSEVYFAHADPNPVVCGNSRKILEDAGICVFEGVKACIAASVEEYEDFVGRECRVFGYSGASMSEADAEGRSVFAEIERYFEAYDYFVRNKKTFVEIKSAITENSFMGAQSPEGKRIPVRITGQGANCWNHGLRAMSDAILVGAGTVIADNPSLNVRFAEGNDPVRIVWAGHYEFTPKEADGLKVFQAETTLVFTYIPQPALATRDGVEVVMLASCDFCSGWREMLATLSGRGFHRLLVEPGETLARLLFEGDDAPGVPEKSPLWNRLDLWRSTDYAAESRMERELGNIEKAGIPYPELPQNVVASESAMVGPDVLTVYYPGK